LSLFHALGSWTEAWRHEIAALWASIASQSRLLLLLSHENIGILFEIIPHCLLDIGLNVALN
jgi:hypothetical protein